MKKLGLSSHIIDNPSCQKLKKFVAEAQMLRKLDLSFVKIQTFTYFIEIIEALAGENKSVQYLNIAGMSFLGNRYDPESMATKERYIQALVFLMKESLTLSHLNLSSCFPGVQIRQGDCRTSLPNPNNIMPNYGEVKPDVPPPICDVQCLFEAVSRSKSLQAVHYSGNSLKLKTINKITEILKVEPGNGYGTDLMSKDNPIE